MACGHTYLGIDYCNIDRLPTSSHNMRIVDKYPSIVVPSSSLKTTLKRHPVTSDPIRGRGANDYSRVFDKLWLHNSKVQHDYDNSALSISDLLVVRCVDEKGTVQDLVATEGSNLASVYRMHLDDFRKISCRWVWECGTVSKRCKFKKHIRGHLNRECYVIAYELCVCFNVLNC